MSLHDESWSTWIHLPGLRLKDGDPLPFADGQLRALDHDAWHALDQTVWQPVDYDDCRPIFHCGRIVGEASASTGPGRGVLDELRARRTRIYRSLALFCVGWPLLPDCARSCTYVKADRQSRCQTFIVGASGRDWILSGHFRKPRHDVDRDIVDEAETVYARLGHLHTSMPNHTLEAAFQALALAALPDTHEALDGSRLELAFVSAITAIEHLTVSSIAEPASDSITRTFALHTAALIATTFSEIASVANTLRETYRLRSDLLHGRRTLEVERDAQAETFAVGVTVLLMVLRNATAVFSAKGPDVDLPALLRAAASDAVAFDALAAARCIGDH